MRRFLLGIAAASLLLALGGCQWVIAVRTIPVSGVVRYPDGTPASVAKVWTDDGVVAWADAQGAYQVLVVVKSGTVTLHARDGYEPGKAYAETNSGSVTVRPAGRAQSADIVLDHPSPI